MVTMLPEPPWQITPASLDPASGPDGVRALAASAVAADGVAPLSEHSLLHLTSPSSRHASAYAGPRLVGYAQVWADGAAELVVAPDHRRRGLGSALWETSRAAGADRAWAHGDLPGAAGLGAAYGLERVRELHRMTRALTVADTAPVGLPDGFRARAFVRGQDEQAWLATNAAAFSHHPEQGSLTRDDLDQRMAQDWFDPSDLLLVEHVDDPGRVAAFHWTKVEPGSPTGWAHDRGGDEGAGSTGETYVVGVDPAYQGRGLAGPLTRLGLAHLARRGLHEVELYVDGDNVRALRTYERAGFVSVTVDVVYADARSTSGR